MSDCAVEERPVVFVNVVSKLLQEEHGYSPEKAEALVGEYPQVILNGITAGMDHRAVALALWMKEQQVTAECPGNPELAELDLARHGHDWALVARDVDNQLREWLKYGHEFEDAFSALEAVREHLHELLANHAVSFAMIP